MSEETAKNFDGEESFETRVLAELGALRVSIATLENRVDVKFNSVESRLTAIEGRAASPELKVEALDEKVGARLCDMRPIREAVLSRLEIIDEKFDVHAHDMLELRAQMKWLEKRVPPAA